jgi:hypothetical protein
MPLKEMSRQQSETVWRWLAGVRLPVGYPPLLNVSPEESTRTLVVTVDITIQASSSLIANAGKAWAAN